MRPVAHLTAILSLASIWLFFFFFFFFFWGGEVFWKHRCNASYYKANEKMGWKGVISSSSHVHFPWFFFFISSFPLYLFPLYVIPRGRGYPVSLKLCFRWATRLCPLFVRQPSIMVNNNSHNHGTLPISIIIMITPITTIFTFHFIFTFNFIFIEKLQRLVSLNEIDFGTIYILL